jgi:uncharacterized membrane protein YkoI
MKLIRNRKFMLVLATILFVSLVGFSANAIASNIPQEETRKTEKASLPVNINAINEDHTAVNTTAWATVSVTQTEPTLAPTTQASSDQHSTPDEQTKISVDQVKQIVLDKVPGATITELELDNDDGRLSYEVEAFNGQTEYDFEIDAYTGAILEFESDKCVDKQVVTASTTQETTPSAQTKISVDQVKQIILAKVQGATITESELDKDDGRLTYDVEAYNGQTEYDFEIDTYTGAILEFETDADDENDDLDEIDDEDEVDKVDKVDED